MKTCILFVLALSTSLIGGEFVASDPQLSDIGFEKWRYIPTGDTEALKIEVTYLKNEEPVKGISYVVSEENYENLSFVYGNLLDDRKAYLKYFDHTESWSDSEIHGPKKDRKTMIEERIAFAIFSDIEHDKRQVIFDFESISIDTANQLISETKTAPILSSETGELVAPKLPSVNFVVIEKWEKQSVEDNAGQPPL